MCILKFFFRSDDGLTPVHIAAAWGRTEILSLLLASGGDPEARDTNYMTPLHYARKEDFVECLNLLRSYLPVKNEILKKEREDCENVNFILGESSLIIIIVIIRSNQMF